METNANSAIGKYFANLEDPQVVRTRRHILLDILVIAICAVISELTTGKTSMSSEQPG